MSTPLCTQVRTVGRIVAAPLGLGLVAIMLALMATREEPTTQCGVVLSPRTGATPLAVRYLGHRQLSIDEIFRVRWLMDGDGLTLPASTSQTAQTCSTSAQDPPGSRCSTSSDSAFCSAGDNYGSGCSASGSGNHCSASDGNSATSCSTHDYSGGTYAWCSVIDRNTCSAGNGTSGTNGDVGGSCSTTGTSGTQRCSTHGAGQTGGRCSAGDGGTGTEANEGGACSAMALTTGQALCSAAGWGSECSAGVSAGGGAPAGGWCSAEHAAAGGSNTCSVTGGTGSNWCSTRNQAGGTGDPNSSQCSTRDANSTSHCSIGENTHDSDKCSARGDGKKCSTEQVGGKADDGMCSAKESAHGFCSAQQKANCSSYGNNKGWCSAYANSPGWCSIDDSAALGTECTAFHNSPPPPDGSWNCSTRNVGTNRCSVKIGSSVSPPQGVPPRCKKE